MASKLEVYARGGRESMVCFFDDDNCR